MSEDTPTPGLDTTPPGGTQPAPIVPEPIQTPGGAEASPEETVAPTSTEVPPAAPSIPSGSPTPSPSEMQPKKTPAPRTHFGTHPPVGRNL